VLRKGVQGLVARPPRKAPSTLTDLHTQVMQACCATLLRQTCPPLCSKHVHLRTCCDAGSQARAHTQAHACKSYAPSACAILAKPPLCALSGEGASRGMSMSSTTTARSCTRMHGHQCKGSRHEGRHTMQGSWACMLCEGAGQAHAAQYVTSNKSSRVTQMFYCVLNILSRGQVAKKQVQPPHMKHHG